MRRIRNYYFLFACLLYIKLSGQVDNQPFRSKSFYKDSSQQTDWKRGTGRYSAKPRNAYEFGIHFGHFITDGDVDPLQPGGFGFGVHLRKAIFYNVSLRGNLFYGQSYGLDPQLTPQSFASFDLNETSARGRHENIYRNFKLEDISTHLECIINVGNMLFHRAGNKWNWYVSAGVGLDFNRTFINALNDDEAYDFSSVVGNVDQQKGRASIKKQIRKILDNTYETEARKKVAIFRYKDDINVHPMLVVGTGISRKLSPRVNISIEHQYLATDNDLLDGFSYRTTYDQSNSNDKSHYTNIRLAFNIGNLNNRAEPLYWLNPLNDAFSDIQDLKNRPVFDTADSDKDGVLNQVDAEPNTPPGALVNVRGITLDSDRDGIPDHIDKEPYSSIGYIVDSEGKALIDKDTLLVQGGMDKEEVDEMITTRIDKHKISWFLPMIHFDNNQQKVKDNFIDHLSQVAFVLKTYPNLKITVTGHTDMTSNNTYNMILAYKRALSVIDFLVKHHGIERSRLLLQYKGEEAPLYNISGEKLSKSRLESINYYNRRVEFKVADDKDQEMRLPDVTNIK